MDCLMVACHDYVNVMVTDNDNDVNVKFVNPMDTKFIRDEIYASDIF